VSDFASDPAQLDMFRELQKGLPVYRGAPSLLPLPEVKNG